MLPVDNLHTPMNYGIDVATNRLELNGDLTTGGLRYYANGQLAQAPNGLGGSHSFVYTAEGYLRCIDACGLGSYLYNGGGDRTLAVRNSTTWNEYAYLNGQPMADVDNTGTWTDYIYANGQKIAKVASQMPLFHLSGLRDSSINMGWGVEGPILGGYGAGTVIAAGDQLAYDFRQTIPSYGGLALILDSGTVGAGDLVDTATGTPTWNDGTADGLWHHRAAKLDEYVGHSLTYAYAGLHNTMPAGWFDMYYANIVILHANGSVTPIYSGQSGVSIPGFIGWNGGCRSCYSGTDLTPTTDLAVNANYYLDDHLGTTQMELSAGGWPLWQGQFTPFGQEIIAGQTDNLIGQQPADGTAMRFKFTGKERDSESGLDYFGARYYASSMSRWMSPDWSAQEEPVPYAKLDDPQSLNLYSYVRNNPLSMVDADGHDLTVAPALQPLVDMLRKQSPSFDAELAAHEGPGSPNLTIGFGPTPNDPNGDATDGNTTGNFGWAGRTSLDQPDLNTYKGADVLINPPVQNDPSRTEDVLEHETGHVHQDRTNPTQSVKDAQHTKDTKGATPHDDRPEERQANAFKAQVKAEQKQYKKEQKQRQKDEKKKKQG